MAQPRRVNRMPRPSGNGEPKPKPVEGFWGKEDRCEAIMEAVKDAVESLGVEGALCVTAALDEAWEKLDIADYLDDDTPWEERESFNEVFAGIGEDVAMTAKNIEKLLEALENEDDDLVPE